MTAMLRTIAYGALRFPGIIQYATRSHPFTFPIAFAAARRRGPVDVFMLQILP